MKNKAKKVILIGMDGLMPEQIARYKGDIPAMQEFLDQGFFSPAHPSPPTDTATNWPTIASGASMGTHGMNSFYFHQPGMELGEVVGTFNSTLCEAEYFYHAAERQGKRCILINYPTAFPNVLKKGVTVGGDGLSSRIWGVRGVDIFSSDSSITNAKRLFLNEPCDWKNIPESYEFLREGVVFLDTDDAMSWDAGGPHVVRKNSQGKNLERHFLVFREEGKTKILMAAEKDVSKAIFIGAEGEWSGWVKEEFNNRKACRQYKVLTLTPDGSQVRILGTMAGSPEGWAKPEGMVQKIIDNVGPYVEGSDLQATDIMRELDDAQPAQEVRQLYADWMAGCAEYLTSTEDWDVMFLQFHCPDGENHHLLRDLESDDAKCRERADSFFREGLRTLFNMALRVKKNCADENTLVAVVSDHGCVPIYKYINLPGILIREGWVKFKYDKEQKTYTLDQDNSLCWSAGNVHINVRGREKHGCVEPGEEYEALRSKIIDRLRAIKDPETGENAYSFVARREDMEHMGMYHPERSEDILTGIRPKYFMHPPCLAGAISEKLMAFWKDSNELIPVEETFGLIYGHGMTATHCTGPGAIGEYSSNRGVLFLSGPGVTHGGRGKKVNLMDVAPTLANFLGIRPPRQSEGRVVWEAFEGDGC